MGESNNSLSNLTDNLIKLQNNNNEILTKLSEVVNSDADTVTFTIQDSSNENIKTITLPSLGNIKKEINRLENNINQLSTLNEANADVRLKDGTFRTIIKSSLKKAGSTLNTTNIPTNFKSKNNWFFEGFLNPFLYVGLDFNGQMNPDTTKVKMSKFILDLNTSEKLNLFNEQIKNNPDLTYADFLDLVTENGISYAIDDDILDLPPVEPRFYGNFSVLRVFEDKQDSLVNGITFSKKVLKFQLDKLFYNDKTSVTLETQQLKVNDSILVNKNSRNTRYTINSIDFETNTISVELAEGFDSVSIGSDILSFYSAEDLTPEVRVGIGFNEYLAVFLKPIDPISNIPAEKYSPCIGFYTNDLVINDNGINKNLSTYYQESVVDFGAFLYSMAKENIPPVSKGVKPNTPTLNPDNFKVVQINKHATDVTVNENLKSLNAEKNELRSKISEIDKSISNKRLEISTKQYKSNIERNSDTNMLKNLIDDRDRNQTLYNSIVSDILSKKSDKNLSIAKPKYRLRGFWELPQPRLSNDGSKQEIIQFKIEYRYITKEGAANNLDEFSVSDDKKGIFSNWNKLNGPLRERVLDVNSGNYFWKEQNLENGDEININQLDIPINTNEGVEIRIKSVSEAGFPTNPLESEWSDIIIKNFPDDLDVSKEISDIFKETESENVKIDLVNELIEKGVYEHVNDQFLQNNTLWKHQSNSIASGFLSDERNVISLFDYLKKLEDKISSLEEKISKTKGKLIISLEDSEGNQKVVNNNDVVQIFAGNYKDIVSNLDNPRGAIVTKSYFLRLQNENATPIELSSGLLDFDLSGSKAEPATYQPSNNPRNIYNNVPIGILSPNNINSFDLPNNSIQVKGQFLYCRDYKITNKETKIYQNYNGIEIGSTTLPKTLKEKDLQSYFFDGARISFKESDKDLEGENSCGAFLFISPVNHDEIRVPGNEFSIKKQLSKGSDIVIQIQYQFRMTDNTGDGLGVIGGFNSNATENLEYSKYLGFDIFWNDEKFSFDLNVKSRYSSNTFNSSDIPTLTFQNTKSII